MKLIFIILLFLIYQNVFSQTSVNFAQKQIIFIGESHYFYGNNKIEIDLINNIIKESIYNNIVIGLEFPKDLEYFIVKNDSNKIKNYLLYNTDKYFKKNKLTKPSERYYNLLIKLLRLKVKYKNKCNIEIKCFNTFYNYRSVYYSLLQILQQNKGSLLYKKYYKDLNYIINSEVIEQSDSLIFHNMKKDFILNKKLIQKQYNKNDFYYLLKILNQKVPDKYNIMNKYRNKYIFNNITEFYNKNTQIICIIGSAHLLNSNTYDLKKKINKKYNIFKNKTFYIDIIPKKHKNIEDTEGFNKIIINNGKSLFK